MGAIFGIIGEASLHELDEMSERLRHRGVYCSARRVGPNAYFGTCSHTAAPAIAESDEVAVIADASIYNVDELLSTVEVRGVHAKSTTPSEVLKAAYTVARTDCFADINGDFAVAIWDKVAQTFTLARDWMGYRPLYYWHGDGRIVFASEYKALLALDGVHAVADHDAIQHLMYSKFTPSNRTFIKDISSVPPAHFVQFTERQAIAKRYWAATMHLRHASEEEHAALIRQELMRAVERRITDVDAVGVAISSGIDSAAVVAATRQLRPDTPISTFTAGYGPDDPEILGAEQVADHFKTGHQSVYTDVDELPTVLPEIVWHLEDPIARSEVVLNYAAARAAHGKSDVLLIGYGADTLFAGMPRHKVINLMHSVPYARQALGEFYTYTQVNLHPSSRAGQLLKWLYYRGNDPAVPHVSGASARPSETAFPEPGDEFLNRFLVGGLKSGSRAAAKYERLQMAFGIESRAPYFDPHLTAAAFTIPSRFKMRGRRDKIIFRKALQPWLPDEAANRAKFPGRMKSDVQFSEALESYARTVLSPSAVRDRGFFNYDELDRLLVRRPHQAYEYEYAMRIWSAVMVELWARAFLDRRGEPDGDTLAYGDGLPASVHHRTNGWVKESARIEGAVERDRR